MTIWAPNLTGTTGPRYAAIAGAIADAIADGSLADGAQLPTHRDLAYRLGCTIGTVSRAYALAERQGLVAGQVGRGTFVIAPARSRPAPPAGGSGVAALHPPVESEPILDLSCNLPNVALAHRALGQHLAAIGAAPQFEALLGYPPASGYPVHRAAIARWVGRHGIVAGTDQVVLTAGTQQALAAAIMTLLQPGEALLCEDPAYAGLRNVAAIAHVRLHGVALDRRGLCPEALDRAARTTGARVAVVTPTLQNPTTATMDTARRAQIAACAAAHDLLLVEDDVYGELPQQRPAALAAIAADRVIYVGSLSKCLAPALRLGWAIAPQRLAARLADRVSALTLNTSPLHAELGCRWIAQDAAAGLPALRRDVAIRQRLVRAALADLDIRGDPEALHLLLMLPAGWSEQEFLRAAREAGIRLAGLDAFRLAPAPGQGGLRLTLSATADLQDLMAAVEKLGYLVRRARPAADRVI